MDKKILEDIAKKLCSPPKGILAADESTNTIKKRFDSINVDSTFESRRQYRELLFKTKDLSNFISGVILFDETIRQNTGEGISFSEFLTKNDIIPGIKVDSGAVAISYESQEKVTEGLDGLNERLKEYKLMGALFTKWRAIIDIDIEKKIPSNNLVPIVEPEVLMDGNHSIDSCFEITKKTLSKVFKELERHDVFLKGILLKPNMVISGNTSSKKSTIEEVGNMTVKCLKETVPEDVPGIVFLSGGQSNEIATEHLNFMNKNFKNLPWKLSFSYGRALQQPSLSIWKGDEKNVEKSQSALYLRGYLNSQATLGEYSSQDENKAL
jgi:fructose-bisphosphate aldolase class I